MTKHYICYPMIEVSERCIGTITVPKGGIKVGEVVVVNTMDNTIQNNFTQFLATTPTDELLRNEDIGIVISGGNYAKTKDGRKPKGNPDYTTYFYEEGKTAPVLFLEPRSCFLSF